MPRKNRKMSLKKADLHPSEIAFLLDDDSYCRPTISRDKASLKSLREGGRQLLYGTMSPTAHELLRNHGQEALEIFQAAHPGKLPSWWELLSPAEQQTLEQI